MSADELQDRAACNRMVLGTFAVISKRLEVWGSLDLR